MRADPTPTLRLHTRHIGLGWFPETAGGLNRYFFELLRALPAAGVGVHGFVIGTEDTLRSSGGSVEPFAPHSSGVFERWRGMRRAWRKEGASTSSLPVCHFAYHAFPVLDRLPARRFVLHFHGPWAEESRVEGQGALSVAVKRHLERAVYSRAGRAIVLSHAFATLLHEGYGVPRERISVIPGGVDVARFEVPLSRAECRARLSWPLDRPIVLATRRLVRRMGLEQLIEAAGLARVQIRDLVLHVVGKGPLEAALAGQIQTAGLGHTVRLLGRLPDDALALAYRAADLTVVPSVALEGFGLVAVEALSAGTPVLVTPVGGLPEVVSPLSDHLVLPDSSPSAIAAGLVSALRGGLAMPDETSCRRFARERYAWPVVAAAVAKVYRHVANGDA